jgi:hypothetical protein
MRLAFCIPACTCLLFLVSGCGPAGPKGQVLKDGQPFVPGDGEFVQISFVPVGDVAGADGSYLAGFNPADSTFAYTDKKKKMPPGQYKVSVQVMKKHKDLLKGKFSPASSPFVFEIPASGDEQIKVDLSTPGSGAPSKGGNRNAQRGAS